MNCLVVISDHIGSYLNRTIHTDILAARESTDFRLYVRSLLRRNLSFRDCGRYLAGKVLQLPLLIRSGLRRSCRLLALLRLWRLVCGFTILTSRFTFGVLALGGVLFRSFAILWVRTGGHLRPVVLRWQWSSLPARRLRSSSIRIIDTSVNRTRIAVLRICAAFILCHLLKELAQDLGNLVRSRLTGLVSLFLTIATVLL